MENKFEKISLVLITIAIIVHTISLAQAADWTQYTPIPTANDIEKIRTYGTYAMALTDTDNILYYNGTSWAQINPPTDAVTIDRIDFDKATDGQFHWIIQNSSRWTQYYTYNPVTKNWGLNSEAQKSEIKSNAGNPYNYFACIHEDSGHNGISGDAECWLLLNNGSIIPYGDASSIPQTLSDPFAIVAGTVLGVQNDEGFATYTIKLYNGASYSTTSSLDSIRDFYIDSASFFSANYITGGTRTTASYNASTGAWITYPLGSTPAHAIAIEPSEARVYYTVDGSGLYEQSYFLTGTPDLVLNTTTFIRDIDFDVINKKGWLGGDNGFLAQNTVSTTGTTETPTQLVYTIYNYTKIDSVITNLEGVTPITATKIYAIGKESGNLAILRYDISNPNFIERENLTITSTASPRSIDALGDTILLGTSSNARLYNNTDAEDVTQLTLKATLQSGLFSDDVISVHYATGNDAYGCDHALTDEIVRYNTTSGTIVDQTSQTCYDLQSSSGGDYIYAHAALSGIKIYHANLTLHNTLNIVTSLGTGNPTDLLSVFGSNLAIVTGRNVIKVYDISTPATPTISWECRASQDITSIELLNENIIVVGTVSSLQVCNLEDDSLYDTGGNYHITKQLITNPTGVIQRDITSTSQSLSFAAAEFNRFGYYQLQIGDLESTNLAPIINSVTVNDETPCINQTVFGTIKATNTDDPLQTAYSYDCENDGVYSDASTGDPNEATFLCSYQTSGVKTIPIKVSDSFSSTTTNKIISVGACVLGVDQHAMTILVRDYLSGEGVPNALVNILGYTNLLTDESGVAYAELPNAGNYNVTISKAGYVTKTGLISTGNFRTIVELQPTSYIDENGQLQGRSILIIHVQGQQGEPVIGASASATDLITATAQTVFTDTNGNGYIYDLPSGTQIRVSAGKEGYQSAFTTTALIEGEEKTINLTLLTTTQTANLTTARGCQDYIKGVWLCSPLNTSATGDTCQSDNDCISGRCSLVAQGTKGTCAIFNWTLCDASGKERGNVCFLGEMTKAGGRGLVTIILDNFLYFALFLILVVVTLIIVGRLNMRNN